MLVQSFRRDAPEHGAYTSRTMFRDTWLSVAVLCNHGLAIDRGVARGALQFTKRFRRPQLTIVLSGRGYLQLHDGRILSLGPGDIAESSQLDHAAEGYSGTPGRVILIDWEGSLSPGAPRVSRIGTTDVMALLSLVDEVRARPAASFVSALAHRLEVLGFRRHTIDPDGLAPAPAPMARLYAALGHALSNLNQHPSLPEMAEVMRASERHVNRQLAQLAQRYSHSFVGWRDFVHEMRLDWATQLLSIPGISHARIADLAGYRSVSALHHAYHQRGADTPGRIARRLAERWG
jgi:AraC-like DNA-binding protein